jgi:hypothetical protein
MGFPPRPTPDEILDGVLETLQRHVLPHVSDDQAADRLRSTIGVLAQVRRRFDSAVEDAIQEAETIEDALRAAGREPPAGPADLRHSTLSARAEALHAALLEAILEAEDSGDAMPRSARDALRSALVTVQQRRA